MNEGVFDLPDAGFVDHTVTYLQGHTPSGSGVLIMVERRPLAAGATLREVVVAQGKEEATRYRNYRVLFEREIDVASRVAIDVGVRWRVDRGESVYVRRVHMVHGSVWLVVTGETTLADQDACDGYVNHVVGSLQLRE